MNGNWGNLFEVGNLPLGVHDRAQSHDSVENVSGRGRERQRDEGEEVEAGGVVAAQDCFYLSTVSAGW